MILYIVLVSYSVPCDGQESGSHNLIRVFRATELYVRIGSLSLRIPFGSRASLANHLARLRRDFDLVKKGMMLTICTLSSQSSTTQVTNRH